MGCMSRTMRVRVSMGGSVGQRHPDLGRQHR
jgi:hypothetical protein